MRAGLLHTYTSSSSSPTRPSVPTRSPMTDYPPPPRPPPYNAAKNAFTPRSSGAQRYKDFRTRPEPATWRGASNDDPKTKTSDFKAWESMRTPRRGEGPIPSQRRPVPPKPARPPPVPPGREADGKATKDPSPRRSGWDHLQEPHSGMPGTTRADTSRGPPQKSGFAPSTPGAGGDEPQARSAYFTVGRGERPTNSRSQTHMPPPPPSTHAPTSKRPDPLAPSKDKVGSNEPFGNKPRASAPYQTGGGEKISPYFASPGIQRSKTSASPRDSNSRTGWYEGKPNNADSAHHRAASASSNHQKMSPPGKKDTRMPGVSGVYSSSSSSSSSSDEDAGPLSSAGPRVTQVPKTRQTRPDASQASVQPHGFNPFAKVGDEPMAPQAGLGVGGYEIPRRHSAVDIDTRKPSEGFSEHRKRHEAEQSQQHSTSVPDASDPLDRAGTQPPLQRSYSWHEKNGPPKDKDFHPAASEQKDKNPMYEPRGYNPFLSPPSPNPPSQDTPSSDKWSDQWPFNSPKKPRTACAEPPPYWAIPSSLPPPKEIVSRKRASTDVPFQGHTQKVAMKYADLESFNSFKIPDYAKNPFPRTASLRSQSSENINTKFSPDNWHGKFFEPPPPSRSNTSRGVSPTKPNMFQQQQEQDFQQSSANGEPMQGDSSEASTSSFPPPPPPPFARGKFQQEQWAPHLNNLKFDMPQSPQGRSPSRTSTRKRLRTRPPRASNNQASVGDAEDDPTTSSATGESLESSKASSDADAMDVDEPTPPSAKTGPPHLNGGYVPPPDVSNTTPRQGPTLPHRSPALPPRTNGHEQPEKKTSHLNLGDLKNVYPFAPSNEGLGNMNEMGTTLPQPSHTSPSKQSTESSLSRMKFPNPPLCPSNPLNLTQHSWDHYCLNLLRYLDEWTKFNDQMCEILKNITRESLQCNWLDPEGNGYDKHMNMLGEHHRARVHLEVACENNEKCLKSLGDAMDAKVRGRGGVGRKQSNAGPVLEGLL